MLFLALSACVSTAPEPEVTSPPTVVAPAPELPGVDVDDRGDVAMPEAASPTRVRRRMDIAQLDASIRTVTGGIGWDVDGRNQWDEVGASLGVPDYVQRTSEDLSPTLLFQKFLDDAANHVCQGLVEAEFDGTSSVLLTAVAPEDTSATNPTGMDATLRAALLRFHGYDVPAGDPQLDSWRFLFDSTLTVTGGDTMAAWRAVCIGLIVHPDFYQY